MQNNLKLACIFKNINLFFFLICVSSCKLFTGELKAREYEGKNFVLSINSAQQAYFLENNKLTKNLDIQSELQNYEVKIISQSDNNKGIMHVAQSKRQDIKSYLGLVYVIKIDGNDLTIARVCESETNAPLTSIPEIPQLPENTTKSEDIKCPLGFQTL